MKGSVVRILELVNICRENPCCSAPASSWCMVSSCDLSPNFGAQRLRSCGSHFGTMLCDGNFLSRSFIWCHVPFENLTARLIPILFLHVEWTFSDKNLDAQLNFVDSFNNETDPFAPRFFDFLLGFFSASTCLKKHVLPYFSSNLRLVVLALGRMPKFT